MSDVFIDNIEKYDLSEIEHSIIDGLRKIGFVIPTGKKILIKPNLLTDAAPIKAITTHPLIVEALVRVFKGNNITIGDSPGGIAHDNLFENTGMKKISDKYKIPLKLLTENIPKGGFRISRDALEADLIINVPKMKTHSLVLFTGAVKNLFGCASGLGQRMKLHRENTNIKKFYGKLFDIYGIIKPTLNVMDAIIGMEGNGPGNGTPKKTGYLLISTDAVALDLVAMDISQLESKDFIHEAKKRNLFSKPKIIGKYNRVPYVKPKNIGRMINLPVIREMVKYALGKPIVIINANKCIKCYRCKTICPVSAISIVNGSLHIDQNKCIRCFCCHEICPASAIWIKRPFIIRLFSKIKSLLLKR